MKQKKLYMKINNTLFLLSSLVMCTLFCGSILGLYSCSIAPTLSKSPVSDIRLGLNKADVKSNVVSHLGLMFLQETIRE